VDELACNVLLLSYRGFGKSEGSPSEAGLQLDALAALDWVRSRKALDRSRVFLFGRSLGGAVAAALAASRPGAVAGVILENTFTSINAMAGSLLSLLGSLVGPGKPLAFLVQDSWRTVDRVGGISAPVLFVCSLRDEMVPPSQMRELWARRNAAARCEWLELPRASHMDAWAVGGVAYWDGLRSFVRRNDDPQSAR
jgi:fermentation-respiration switch protein FrsA (DUF1100 family)